MVERVLVVGPKDCIAMVDDLAPKGFEIVKALHNSPEMKEAMQSAEYLVGFVDKLVDAELYKDAPKLKLIQLLSAGYDRADLEAARKAGVPIWNNGGANSVAVSEHAILLMLAASRQLIRQHKNVTAGNWRGNARRASTRCAARRWASSASARSARRSPGWRRLRHDVHYYDIARLTEERRTRSACASACCPRSCSTPTS